MKLAIALTAITLFAVGILSLTPAKPTKKECEEAYWKTEAKILEQGLFRETQCKLAGDDEACYSQLLSWAMAQGELSNKELKTCLARAVK